MILIAAFILVTCISVLLIPFVNVKWKAIAVLSAVGVNSIISTILAVQTLMGHSAEFMFTGSSVTHEIPIRIDALSGWFILILNITFLTGAFYGLQYMKAYKEQKNNLSLHCISFILAYVALIGICSIQNSMVFLYSWEIMALASFFLIIFEHYKHDTLKAGINFLIQSHVCVLFLILGFIWVAIKTNSYDFKAISVLSHSFSSAANIALFICFFIGFAIKAGFVPFHTWLPHAHPAAPSHISGIMSGVIIKIGIYGILRMLLLIKGDYLTIGYIILFISIISGLYGVMLAIIQHNLKKLLAYHSIENIGIIGIGIGIGCIGWGTNNEVMVVLGFSGALLHTLNHSLFKSLLFYGAGNIYQIAHTMNIDQLGGFIKRVPHTAYLFLIAALAICGLPPFNGFISEFLLYSGLFNGIQSAAFPIMTSFMFGIFGLVLIGGLALLCFTKAFGIVFLGSPRHHFHQQREKESTRTLIPMYFIAFLIMAIGIFPNFFLQALAEPMRLFSTMPNVMELPLNGTFTTISIFSFVLIAFSLILLVIKTILSKKTAQTTQPTWGCGYVGNTEKMQYTASSYVKSYRKLFDPVFSITKKEKDIKNIFPGTVWHETHPHDKLEEWLIHFPIRNGRYFLRNFSFLQNGKVHVYILYGALFIGLIIGIPLIYHKIIFLIEFFKSL